MKKYLTNVLLWIDIGTNVLLFGGSPYETLSSRVGKQAEHKVQWACLVCRYLDRILNPEHCKKSEVPDYDKSFQWWKR
jgi:hypothetical protein